MGRWLFFFATTLFLWPVLFVGAERTPLEVDGEQSEDVEQYRPSPEQNRQDVIINTYTLIYNENKGVVNAINIAKKLGLPSAAPLALLVYKFLNQDEFKDEVLPATLDPNISKIEKNPLPRWKQFYWATKPLKLTVYQEMLDAYLTICEQKVTVADELAQSLVDDMGAPLRLTHVGYSEFFTEHPYQALVLTFLVASNLAMVPINALTISAWGAATLHLSKAGVAYLVMGSEGFMKTWHALSLYLPGEEITSRLKGAFIQLSEIGKHTQKQLAKLMNVGQIYEKVTNRHPLCIITPECQREELEKNRDFCQMEDGWCPAKDDGPCYGLPHIGTGTGVLRCESPFKQRETPPHISARYDLPYCDNVRQECGSVSDDWVYVCMYKGDSTKCCRSAYGAHNDCPKSFTGLLTQQQVIHCLNPNTLDAGTHGDEYYVLGEKSP